MLPGSSATASAKRFSAKAKFEVFAAFSACSMNFRALSGCGWNGFWPSPLSPPFLNLKNTRTPSCVGAQCETPGELERYETEDAAECRKVRRLRDGVNAAMPRVASAE